MSITTNIARIGSFTSSEIVALTTKDKKGDGFGAPAKTYIAEKNMERRLGRSIDSEVDSRPLMWGRLLESNVHDLLPTSYVLCSQETFAHPTIPYWAGSVDGLKYDEGKTVTDIKSPFTMKSFCQLVDPLYNGLTGMDAMNAIRENHKDGEKYYWQLVSNSIIHNAKYGELIVYCPYQSELAEIKKLGDGMPEYYWLYYAEDTALPYLIDGGFYKNINIIRFEIEEKEKIKLTELVKMAGELLNINK